MFDPPKWYSYEFDRPQQDLPIILQVWHGLLPDDFTEVVIVPQELAPEINVMGWRWRPTGIFTEMGGEISHMGLQRMNSQNSWLNSLAGLLGPSAGLGASQMYGKDAEGWDQ